VSCFRPLARPSSLICTTWCLTVTHLTSCTYHDIHGLALIMRIQMSSFPYVDERRSRQHLQHPLWNIWSRSNGIECYMHAARQSRTSRGNSRSWLTSPRTDLRKIDAAHHMFHCDCVVVGDVTHSAITGVDGDFSHFQSCHWISTINICPQTTEDARSMRIGSCKGNKM
jgi:hypothetical protein